MCDLYKRIHELCQTKGISVGRMCADLSISRGNLTELKMGRIKTLKADNLAKISTYFNVTVGFLLGIENEKAPTSSGERSVSDDEIKFALFGGGGEITDEMYDEVKRFAAYIKQREAGKK